MAYDPRTANIKTTRAGGVTVTVLETTKAVTFASPMPSANYRVVLQVLGNLVAVLWPTSKTANGFTLNLSIGISGDIDYIAVED